MKEAEKANMICTLPDLLSGATGALDDMIEVLHSLEESLLDAMYEHEALRAYKPSIQQIDLLIQSIADISGLLQATGASLPHDSRFDASSAVGTLKLAKISNRILTSLGQDISETDHSIQDRAVSIF